MVTNDVVLDFISRQIQVWDTARNNFEALQHVKVKTFQIGKSTVKVQFNPARIVSSAAKVDAKSLKERRCFLCKGNRPSVQEGLAWDGYMILLNPYPIFPKHLTIPDNEHVDQRIRGRIGDMMGLAMDLAGFTLFYNGPKCGASAPDHMHFQAGNRGFMPIEEDIQKAGKTVVVTRPGAQLSHITGLVQTCCCIEATDKTEGEALFCRLYDAMNVPEAGLEPMMNILCWYEDGRWTILVFPRKKHRPDCYFAEGDANILISPASVDMGGVFITPLEKDFNKIAAEDIKIIFNEVCYSEDEVGNLINKVK